MTTYNFTPFGVEACLAQSRRQHMLNQREGEKLTYFYCVRQSRVTTIVDRSHIFFFSRVRHNSLMRSNVLNTRFSESSSCTEDVLAMFTARYLIVMRYSLRVT